MADDEREVDPAGGRDDAEEEASEGSPAVGLNRDRDLLGSRRRSPLRTKLDELCSDIWKGFEDQASRSDCQVDYWNCYNCETDGNQYYDGIAQIYFPAIRDAVNARTTRFGNQLFPQSGRYVEAVASDGSTPSAMIALLEHYLHETRFETQVLKPMLRNGDIEGQLNLYVDWAEFQREIVSRETHGPKVKVEGVEVEAPGEEIDDVAPEDVIEGRPVFEVLHDPDVLVLPATVDSVEEALSVGGSVTLVRRWTKTKIDDMAEMGNIRDDEAKILREEMGKIQHGAPEKDVEKILAEHIGIRAKGGTATVWETWTMLPLGDDGMYRKGGTRRLCRVFFGPGRAQLGAKRNPYWNDRCPLLSCPVEKQAGVFKGDSLVRHVTSLQYEANDAVNEGADAATFSAAPIVRRDPEKSSGPLVFNIGAIWEGEHGAIELMTFPDLTPRAATRVQMALQAIFQSLGVNPSMLPQQTRSGKPNQAQVAQEQQVDLLTTSEAVKVAVEGILDPAMGWIVDLDYQFRDRPLTVRMFGDLGKQAELQQVAPLQNRAGFSFRWRGGEQVKMQAMMQQQGNAALAVVRGLRQELGQEGYQLHLGPAVQALMQATFGAPLGAQILIDQRHQLTMPQDQENVMLGDGFDVPVHPLDNDAEHLKALMPWLQETGDPHGTGRVHAQAHLQQIQMKNQAAMMKAAAGQGMPPGGRPPGGPPGAGQPQPGAAPGPPHAVKRPPGAVHPDRSAMTGITQMPRRT